jgi:hypothetical protein
MPDTPPGSGPGGSRATCRWWTPDRPRFAVPTSESPPGTIAIASRWFSRGRRWESPAGPTLLQALPRERGTRITRPPGPRHRAGLALAAPDGDAVPRDSTRHGIVHADRTGPDPGRRAFPVCRKWRPNTNRAEDPRRAVHRCGDRVPGNSPVWSTVLVGVTAEMSPGEHRGSPVKRSRSTWGRRVRGRGEDRPCPATGVTGAAPVPVRVIRVPVNPGA